MSLAFSFHQVHFTLHHSSLTRSTDAWLQVYVPHTDRAHTATDPHPSLGLSCFPSSLFTPHHCPPPCTVSCMHQTRPLYNHHRNPNNPSRNPLFREGKSRMVQRQQQKWENPVRENTTHYTVGYTCKVVLSSYLALGCERTCCVILPAEGWPYLYVWTVCPCIYAYVI
jgi:hypothetical protein